MSDILPWTNPRRQGLSALNQLAFSPSLRYQRRAKGNGKMSKTTIEPQPITTIEKPRTPAVRILDELSRGTYVSYSRALKELLSNAWDALATEVQIKIADDLSEITVLDDGTGMSEEDIKERFLRIGGTGVPDPEHRIKEGRRIIGHKGIGALSVIPICREVRVLTTQKGSSQRTEAVLDIHKILEVAKHQEDLATHYVYELNKWDNEKVGTHYTFITLRDLTPDMREFLGRKGLTLNQYMHTTEELSGIEKLKWDLSVVAPVEYSKDGPFKERDVKPVNKIKAELSKANFSVQVNGEKLFKPILLPSADIKYTGKYKRGLDYEIYPVQHSDENLEFAGYVFSQATAIIPADIRGGLVRVNNVAIGNYDLNWLGYQRSVGPRLGMTTGEIFVYRGLDQAILIDRDRFRETDPNFKRFRQIVHATLHEAFGGATTRSRKRAALEQKTKAETFLEKMESKVSQYLTYTYRTKPATLEVEDLGDRPPLIVDRRTGKVVINQSHKIFKKLKPGEREIVETFLLAIGIGKERSHGDVNTMLEEIFKIAADLIEARRKK